MVCCFYVCIVLIGVHLNWVLISLHNRLEDLNIIKFRMFIDFDLLGGLNI
jgi:hypothetical protein